MSPDWLLARLSHLDPARNVAVDEDHADALLGRIRSEMISDAPGAMLPSLRSRFTQLARLVPAALVVAVVVAVVVLSTQLRARAPGSRMVPGRSQASSGSGRQALLDMLGVLRRPQTAVDRKVFSQSGLASGDVRFFGSVDAASARVATITAWGSRVLLVLTDLDRQERLIVWQDHGGGAGGTAAVIRAGREVETQGWGATYAGGSTGVRADVVVPDGVARVSFVLAQSAGAGTSGPSYSRPLRLSVRVHGNIAAFEARRSCCEGAVPMIWYAADGRVIRQIGHVSPTQPTSHPAPAPGTEASRAAQRDPGTPNPVSVSPLTGGPTTRFRISWRLLLTGAAYQFNPVGPQGVDCYGANAIPGGLSGGTTDVRGHSYGETFGPSHGHTWCPGTYRVSVNVLAFGAGSPALRPTPLPFGSISFTVRG
jgi:hypothetical protein